MVCPSSLRAAICKCTCSPVVYILLFILIARIPHTKLCSTTSSPYVTFSVYVPGLLNTSSPTFTSTESSPKELNSTPLKLCSSGDITSAETLLMREVSWDVKNSIIFLTIRAKKPSSLVRVNTGFSNEL